MYAHRSFLLGMLGVVAATLGGGLVAVAPGADPGVSTPPLDRRRADRAAASSPRAATCASCHPKVVDRYRATGHAQSISHFDPETAPEQFGDATVCNAPSDLCYEAYVEHDTLHQREFRRTPDGRIVHERVHEVDYVIGSGNATRSYLMSANGFVTEMPLTWYTEEETWAMSPGYEASNDRFGRQINLSCMTCHNAKPERTRFTQNHYTDVPTGISCARCHGGGAGHVAFHRSDTTTGTDPIVTPTALSRERELSTCNQCHLAGLSVFRPGESPVTYEAGERLRTNRTVFVPTKQLTDPNWVGIDSHPIRLARSACFKQSDMTCVTCHDAHEPAEATTTAEYNATCRSCHNDPQAHTLCSRETQMPTTGNCLSCHMQQGGTSNVPHVTFTDHWIRTDPEPSHDPGAGRPSFDSPTPLTLTPLRDMTALTGTPADDPGRAAAEAAQATFRFFETMHRHPEYVGRTIARARRALSAGVRGGDLEIALARALSEADSTAAAANVMRRAARRHPDNAWVHYWHGVMATAEQRYDAAVRALRRALDLQPKMVDARSQLASVLVQTNRPAAALRQLDTLVEIDSVHSPRAWYNIGLIRLRAEQVRPARDALRRATRLNPDLVPAHLQLGRLYFRAELYDQAETHFRRALAADSTDASVHGSLGLLYARTNAPEKARRHLQRALELDPDNQTAQRLLRRLRR